jgi:hypothetical protein
MFLPLLRRYVIYSSSSLAPISLSTSIGFALNYGHPQAQELFILYRALTVKILLIYRHQKETKSHSHRQLRVQLKSQLPLPQQSQPSLSQIIPSPHIQVTSPYFARTTSQALMKVRMLDQTKLFLHPSQLRTADSTPFFHSHPASSLSKHSSNTSSKCSSGALVKRLSRRC